MSAPHARWSRTVALVVGALAATAVLTACEETTLATVTHIVDGDTIDVQHDGEERRVRLLNIDTPESTDADVEPDCLGPEATDFLEALMPVGTEVRLETDEELKDQYGRFLAGVYLENTLVNAEIARAGLGVAVLYEPNSRFHDEVVAAQEEARAAQRGLYDPAIGCTLPAQVRALIDSVETVGAAAPAEGASTETLEGYAQEVAVAVGAALALEQLLNGDVSRFPLVVLSRPDLDAMRRSVTSTATELNQVSNETRAAIEAEETRLAAEEARRLAAEEQARQAAEEARRAAEEAERRAAEDEARQAAEEAERQATERRAQERRQQESQPSEQPQRSTSSGSSGGYDGYTGCRAYGGNYAPNAVDEQGRRYTKIDCTTKTPIG